MITRVKQDKIVLAGLRVHVAREAPAPCFLAWAWRCSLKLGLASNLNQSRHIITVYLSKKLMLFEFSQGFVAGDDLGLHHLYGCRDLRSSIHRGPALICCNKRLLRVRSN